MFVYIIELKHRAEGDVILGVFDSEKSEQEMKNIAKEHSPYSSEETAKWCDLVCTEYKVLDGSRY